MNLLAPVRRWGRGWPVTLPLYDGRECPLCKATVCGKDSRIAHKEWHEQREEYDQMMIAALHAIADKTGLKVQVRALDETTRNGAGDPYETIRIHDDDDDDGEDYDDE